MVIYFSGIYDTRTALQRCNDLTRLLELDCNLPVHLKTRIAIYMQDLLIRKVETFDYDAKLRDN